MKSDGIKVPTFRYADSPKWGLNRKGAYSRYSLFHFTVQAQSQGRTLSHCSRVRRQRAWTVEPRRTEQGAPHAARQHSMPCQVPPGSAVAWNAASMLFLVAPAARVQAQSAAPGALREEPPGLDFCITCRIPNSTAKIQSPYSIDRYIIDIYEIRRQRNINVMVIIEKERVILIIFQMITMFYLSNTYCCEHNQCGKTRIRLTLVLMNPELCKQRHDMRSHTRSIMFRSG